jgi:HEAT repeat protein
VAARKANVDAELARVRSASLEPQRPESAEVITEALSSKHARLVVAAAHLVKARRLEGYNQVLKAAYRRFLDDPVKRDPGCQAKLAVLEALDYSETMDDEPFVAATSLVQPEPAWGAPADTAAPCRARAVLALARLGHPDLALFAGPLLADPDVSVRATTAEALGHSGSRPAAGLLLHKLAVGDEDPLVLLACMSSVLSLAAEVALERLVPLLAGRDEQRRELAAMCLGQSGRADACQALVAALAACVLSRERGVLLKALGLHRSDSALEALLEVVEGPNDADAQAAIAALAPRRFEPGLRARLEKVTQDRADLSATLAATFRDP